jgi:D-alanyl-D-alanine-carboxypeptidase/D-alanyl-D-alanine-endopeptidase
MAWLPDYGVGMFAMASLTYAGPAEPISQAWDALLKTGGLQKRELPVSPILSQMRDHIVSLWKSWNDTEAKQIAAMNLFLDAPVMQRRAEIEKLKSAVGECTAAGPVIPENWLRGQFNMACRKGTVAVFFTLAPMEPPAVQHLEFRKIDSESVRLAAPTGAPPGVACAE